MNDGFYSPLFEYHYGGSAEVETSAPVIHHAPSTTQVSANISEPFRPSQIVTWARYTRGGSALRETSAGG